MEVVAAMDGILCIIFPWGDLWWSPLSGDILKSRRFHNSPAASGLPRGGVAKKGALCFCRRGLKVSLKVSQ